MKVSKMKQRFVEKLPKVDICLMGLQGSRAYNLDARGDSDYDYRGVYVADIEEVLSFKKPKPQYVYCDSRDDEMDYVVYEVEKFLRLAMKGNPSILNLFFLPQYNIKNNVGNYIVENREVFLGETRVRNAFGGYAMSQILYLKRHGKFKSKIQKRDKHVKHCFRLFHMGQELLETGKMTFPLSKEKVQDILEITKKSYDHEIFEIFEKRDKEFRACKSVLPKKPDEYLANKILFKIRNELNRTMKEIT